LVFREGNLDAELLLAEVQDLKTKISSIKEDYSGVLKKLSENDEVVLKNQTERINFLETELSKYKVKSKRTTKPVNDIALEFSTLYPEAVEISYNELIRMNTESKTLDTLPTVVIHWEGRRVRSSQKKRIEKFFQTRMKLDTISVIIY
jgi:predicted nuclease with TOPRIM domain